jgi:hypothetical protein
MIGYYFKVSINDGGVIQNTSIFRLLIFEDKK